MEAIFYYIPEKKYVYLSIMWAGKCAERSSALKFGNESEISHWPTHVDLGNKKSGYLKIKNTL